MGYVRLVPNSNELMRLSYITMNTDDNYYNIIEHLKKNESIEIKGIIKFTHNFPNKNGKLAQVYPGLKFEPSNSLIMNVSQSNKIYDGDCHGSKMLNIKFVAIKKIEKDDFIQIPKDLDVHITFGYSWLVLML